MIHIANTQVIQVNVNSGPRGYRKQLHSFEAPWGANPDREIVHGLPGVHPEHTDIAHNLAHPPVNVPQGPTPTDWPS